MAARYSIIALVLGFVVFLGAEVVLAQGAAAGGYIDSAFYTFDTEGPTECGSNENPSADILESSSSFFGDVIRTDQVSCNDGLDDTFGASGFSADFELDRALEIEVQFGNDMLEEYHFGIKHQRDVDGPTEARVTYSLDFGTTWVEFDPFDVSIEESLYEVYLCIPPTSFLLIHVEARGGNGGAMYIDDLEMAVTIITPVELTSFNGTVSGNGATLIWITASETNNAGFEVEMRSADDVDDYDSVAFVEGHGTTTEVQNYAYSISDLDPGGYSFRLKQIDFDGAFEYSDEIEVAVAVPGTHMVTNAYPNPFNPQAQFSLSVAQTQNVTVGVYDALGRRVLSLFNGPLDGGRAHSFTLDGSGLATGLLFIRAAGETFVTSQSITLVR